VGGYAFVGSEPVGLNSHFGEIAMYGWFTAAACCFLLLVSAGCEVVDSYPDTTDRNPAWIFIDSPAETPYHETKLESVELGGSVFIAHIDEDPYAFDARYLIPRDTGVIVNWRNESTGEGGRAGQAVHAVCYGGYYYATYCDWVQLWGTYVDLAIGENNIVVTAEDDSGHSSSDSITIIQPLLHSPIINSFSVSILSSTSLKCDLGIDTGGLDCEVRFHFSNKQTQVILVPAEPAIKEVTHTLTGLDGDGYFVWPVVSNRLGTEVGTSVDSRLRYPAVWDLYAYGGATYNMYAEADMECSVYTGGLETRVWFDWRIRSAECDQESANYWCAGSFGHQTIPPSEHPVTVTAYKDQIYRDMGYVVIQTNVENAKGKPSPVCAIPSQDGDLYVTCH